MLTPLDIHDKEFKRSFRGYDEDEIDDFLDRVVNDYEKLFRENDDLKERLARASKDNEEYQKMERGLRDTLLLAQKTSEEIVGKAKDESKALMKTTTQKCDTMRQEAELYVKQQAEEVISQAREKALTYDQIIRDRVEYLRKLKDSMEGELSVIDESIASAMALKSEEGAGKKDGQEETNTKTDDEGTQES